VVSGHLVQTLSAHRASICSLCSIKNFLISGGDNGCGSLIVWDTEQFKMKRKVSLHSAALTCIADLGDGGHLATGGYDRKIYVFDYKRGETVFEDNSCKMCVTSMVVCEQSRKLVTACLDKTLSIWTLLTKVSHPHAERRS
jgi:WD40 repeat protein